MSRISIGKCLNTALAVFYQSLTRGEIPNVKRCNPNPDNWPALLGRVKNTRLDFLIPMTVYGFDPELYKGVWLFTMEGQEIMLEFQRKTCNDDWMLFSVECAGPRHRKDFFESKIKCS